MTKQATFVLICPDENRSYKDLQTSERSRNQNGLVSTSFVMISFVFSHRPAGCPTKSQFSLHLDCVFLFVKHNNVYVYILLVEERTDTDYIKSSWSQFLW